MMNDKTFMKITNKNIFDSVEQTKKAIIEFKTENEKAHNNIITRLDKTNGNVRMNKIISRSAITLAFIILGWFVGYLISTAPK